ncbi:MAG: IPT/TIG domain-containing protein [Bacteroidetes bacterium]|nr:IPT/TIG domain-containing protein [Bacteroidota bacterium]
MFKNWSNLLSLKIFFFIQIFSLVISFSSIAADQCMLLPITVQKRTQEASLIVEAEVLSSQSFWTKNHDMIYTIHHLKIYKLFKGNPSLTEFDILTEGGTVGLDKVEITSSLSLFPGQQGVFFCNVSKLDKKLKPTGGNTLYDAYGSEQGFIEYNVVENLASTPFYHYTSITGQLYSELTGYTGAQFVQIAPNTLLNQSIQKLQAPKSGGNSTLAIPTITSFTPTSITAGTRSLLTINGTNFGATRGTGFVEFKNANDGGTTYVKAKDIDYRTWTSTQITVWVPSSSLTNGPSAGTGTIRVTNSDPNSVTSAATLTVTYSHINVEYNNTGFYTEHINDNTTGGYTFQFESARFASNAPAVAAFTRAMNTWTCNTNMNWIIGANTAVDTVLADGINIVRFDIGPSLPAGVLGRATSRLSGCVGGVDTVWTVTEIDVIYDDGAAGLAWQFGPSNATISQVDFESVTVHELGHAHQLQHIILSGAVMHYSIANGQTTRTLSAANDIAGGNYVLTKSVAAHGACKLIANALTTLSLASSISIGATGTNVCSNASVTFTATSVVPAGTPTYQWKKNGVNVGTNSTTYTNASWVNGDVVTCVMTVSGGCNEVKTSNAITMTVSSPVAASVTISASPSVTICSGTSVTFTAVPTNGGTPTYQWKKNGVNVGTNSTTYTDAALANGNTITCVMTSSLGCVTGSPATSNTLTMTVNASVAAGVSISASPSGTICAGTSVTFTAVPTNGGASPSYQWKKNGVNVGTNSTTYTDAGLVSGNTISCVMTSNATCVTGSPATSNTITMTVNANVTASVVISASPSTSICSGTNVTFTAVPTNGGTTPSYQWKKNGVNVGTNSTTYSDAGLANGNTITCVMTSNATCVTGSPATSNTITMTVTPSVTASVSISASPSSTICAGTSVTFTAVPTNGGTTPSYQWKKNGVNVGTNSTTYTDAGLVNGNTITCILTSNATCVNGSPATSNTVTMTVNANVAASVAISASPSGTICAGTSVTFTAVPTNGGTTPSYQWKKNGVNVGTNSTTYTDAALATGNTISCVMTSNATCATGNPATSNTITMTVNASVAASVSISASPSTTICSGTSVTFTATPANGGPTPSYQWKKNGVNVGTNSTTYTDAALANGNTITCDMTSNANCVTGSPATSNTITMTVNANVTASVTISASPSITICAGTSVTFTATPTNGGLSPSYQWKKNGANVGTNSPTYTDGALTNGNTINCLMTSNATCVTGSPATSNTITMTVNGNVAASVAISASPSSTICAGTSVTFTAVPTNGGTTPSYQWKKNGTNVGTNSSTYSDAALANGNVITCVMTSNATCATGNPATSNAITMTVNPNLPASVSISASPSLTICSGTNVTFTAAPTNGGTTPVYQWKKNGSNVGTNSASYADATLTNGNTITCVMTSNATCATGNPATSNTLTMVVNPAPTVTSFSPSNGSAGTSVVITGTNFSAATTVLFNATSASFVINSATQITATVPAGAASGTIKVSNTCGTGTSASSFLVNVTFTLTVFIEGYYNAGSMPAVVNPIGAPTVCDTVTVVLANFANPTIIDATVKGVIGTNGTGIFIFPSAMANVPHWVGVRQRNTLETWSSNIVNFPGTSVSYNFTTAISQALGSNQVSNGDGTFSIRSGDTNQNGSIESTDFTNIQSDSQIFLTGYVATDLTGDRLVESADYSLIENNSFLLLFAITP